MRPTVPTVAPAAGSRVPPGPSRLRLLVLLVLAGLLSGLGAVPASAAVPTVFQLLPFCEGTTQGLAVYNDATTDEEGAGYRLQVTVTTATGDDVQVLTTTGPFTNFEFPQAQLLTELSVHERGDGTLDESTLIVAFDDRIDAAGCAASFSDVPDSNPFFAEIEWMNAEGISEGYADGTFRPAATVSRQAMAAFMFRFDSAAGYTPPATPTFGDVPTTSPFYAQVEWMAEEGISTGYEDGTFRPTAPVSRQAMSAFLYRLLDEGGYTGPATPSFSDVTAANPFYDSVEWMAYTEISAGYAAGGAVEFRPAATVTRQAMAAFMFRADDVFGR